MISAKNLIISVVLLLVGFTGGVVFAQTDNYSESMDHSSHTSGSLPNEGGQAAFNAIAEIVSILEADPETDWSKVNISILRNHLVDMNALTLSATVDTFPEAQGVRFLAKGTGTTLRALANMVPAHARELDKMAQWSATGRSVSGGAELVVIPRDDAAGLKIRALGFFGLMATGAHHQRHHLAMATGNAAH